MDNIDVPGPETLQRALNRAMERHGMALFTPVGQARKLAAVTLRLAAGAIAAGDTRLAAGVLDQAWPESPDAPSRPSPPAPALPSACSISGWPGTTPAPRPAWPR